MSNTPKSKVISEDQDNLILVDENDQAIGHKTKVDCHLGKGTLHRAFSVFIFDSQQKLLLQCRSDEKMLWPGFWANSCCSHPRLGETMAQATARRIEEELGLSCEVSFIYKFQYFAQYGDIGAESELCHVYVGQTDQSPQINPNEVCAIKYLSAEAIDNDVATNNGDYAPWFKLEWAELRRRYWQDVLKILD